MSAAQLTYPQWIEQIKSRQLKFIAAERARFDEAQKLWDAYLSGMLTLGLHPLTRMEIADRRRELDGMEKNIEQTHGDNEVNQAIYKALTETVKILGVDASSPGLIAFHTGGPIATEAPFFIGEQPSETCVDRTTGQMVPR